MASIDQFKTRFRGGARPNQFRVLLTSPTGIDINLDTENTSFLVKASSLPGQTLGELPIPFRGRNLYIAGDREFETWTTTVLNDPDFTVRNALERWMNGINDLSTNTGLSSPSDYQTDATVEQLGRDGSVLKTYRFEGIYPQALDAIEVSWDTTNTVEEFICTWRYQQFTASGVNF